jgi:hypothetical protein
MIVDRLRVKTSGRLNATAVNMCKCLGHLILSANKSNLGSSRSISCNIWALQPRQLQLLSTTSLVDALV